MVAELSRVERFCGCLVGLAVGDAIGAPLRGMKSGHVRQVYGEIDDYVDAAVAWKGKPHRWSLCGLYTSNTQRALAVADIVARDGKCDARALADVLVEMADAHVEGSRCGCHRRVSRNFQTALERMRSSALDPLDCGGPSAGCGAAARVAPLGLFYAGKPGELTRTAIETSLVTHRDPRAVAAALAVAFVVAGAVSGGGGREWPTETAGRLADDVRVGEEMLLRSYGSHLIHREEHSTAHHVSESLGLLPRLLEEGDDRLAYESIVRQANRCSPERPIRDAGQGFAPVALMSALYLALSGRSFVETVAAAVALGREAHDLGAMVGAIVGARDGVEAIPSLWLSSLRNADQVRLRAENLARGAIDYSSWCGVVELESEATAAEERERRRLAKRWEKEGVLVKKTRRPRPQPRPPVEPGFAPPPEVWLQPKKRPERDRRVRKQRRDRRGR